MLQRFSALLAAVLLLSPLTAEARSYRPTFPRHCSGCSTQVKGHYRTSSTGKTYYVRSHTRHY